MKRFKKILFYVDEREQETCPLARAVDLARQNNARLTIAGVLRDLPRDLRLLLTAIPLDELQRLAIEELRNRLVKFCGASLANTETMILVGSPPIEIIKEVLRNGHDLVIMGADRQSAGSFLGTTAMKLLRKCPCPVWVIGSKEPAGRSGNIIAAIDPDPSSEEQDPVNTQIIELAASLAHMEKSTLHIVNALEADVSNSSYLPWGNALYPDLSMPEKLEEMDTRARHLEAAQRKQIAELLQTHALSGIKHEIHIVRDSPSVAIRQVAADTKADLIVMSTIVRAGIAGVFMGSTAESVLYGVRCSVLAIKPPGFKTPVSLKE